MANCCPLSTSPTTVAATVCAFNIKEVDRIYAHRGGEVIWDIATAGAANVPATITGDIVEDSAGWTTLRTAPDSTKVLTLPLFGSDPTLTPGGEISSVGLRNTKNHIGYDPSDFSAFFEGLTAEQESNINEITCEGATWEIYFIMHDKGIIGQVDDVTTPTTFRGIPLASALLLLGRALAGFTENDKNECQFQLLHEWSQTMYKITPNFNTLTY